MPGSLTTNTLIDSIKRKAMLPSTQNTFRTVDFLAFANDEMDIGVVPSILSLHEEYYVYSEEIPLEADKSRYPIPYRAIGGKLRDLFYQDTNGNLKELSRIQPEDKAIYQLQSTNTGFIFFYIEGNDIILTPQVSSTPTGSLVASYYLRPNDLVEESRAAVITSISSSLGVTTYTVDGVPTGMSTSTEIDIIQARSGHKTKVFDINPNSVNSNTSIITFLDTDLPDDVIVGDYVCFAGETIVPQCPSDLHNILAQRVAARCLESLGDTAGLNAANAKIAEMEVKTGNIIDSRVDGSPQKVTNFRGILQYTRFRRSGWR